jgi:hypothetical protein
VYDVWVWREEGVGLDFLQREADAFLAEGTSDLLEREELLIGVVLNEVDVGEATL